MQNMAPFLAQAVYVLRIKGLVYNVVPSCLNEATITNCALCLRRLQTRAYRRNYASLNIDWLLRPIRTYEDTTPVVSTATFQ